MTGAPSRLHAGWVTLTATSAAASIALAVLTIACVFVAMAGPRQSLGFRTSALQQMINEQPRLGRSVVAEMSVITLAGATSGSGDASVTLYGIQQAGGVLRQSLVKQPLPLRPASASWYGLTADYTAVVGAARRAYFGPTAPPQLALLYRNGLVRYSRLLTGSYPNTVTAVKGVAVFQIAVTPATAYRFGLHVGSVLRMAGFKLRVSGIILPAGPPSDFWQAFGTAATPLLNKEQIGYVWLGAAFFGAGEVDDLQAALGTNAMTVEWDFPLDLRHVKADQASGLLNNLIAAKTADGNVLPNIAYSNSAFGGPVFASIFGGLINPLTSFVVADAQIGGLMSLLYVSLTVVGAVMLLLGCRLLVERRSAEFRLMRARGASAGQLASLAIRAGSVVVLPAAVASGSLAVAVTPGDGESLAWWLAGIVVLVALAGVAVLAVRSAPPTSAVGQRADQPVTPIGQARRWAIDATLVLAAVAGLVVLRQQGLPAAGRPDYVTSAAPVLVTVPIAIIVVRVLPALARWLAQIAWRRPGVAVFVGLARAAQSSIGSVLPAFALVLALAVVAFGAALQMAIRGGQEAAAWHATGADAIVNATASPFPVSGTVQRAIAAVPGVRQAVAVSVQPGSTEGGSAIRVVVVPADKYAALIAATPDQPFDVAALAGPAGAGARRVIPAIASPSVAAQISRNPTIHVGNYTIRVRVAGRISSTPAAAGGAFIIVASADAAPIGRPAANEVLIVGPTANGGKLQKLVNRVLPGAVVTMRSAVLAALADAPLPHGAYVTFLLAAIAAAGLCAAILFISLVLGARPRELTLAHLATMGLSAGQSRRLVCAEALPAIIAAILGGMASALILVPLVAPAIDLSVFTGSGAAVRMGINLPVISYVAAGLLVVALGTLLAQLALTRARGVTRALRVGE